MPSDKNLIKESDNSGRTFSRGLDVIEALGRDTHGKTIANVAEETGISRAAARRLLTTLVERGFASTDRKTFFLTPRVLNLGFAYLNTLPFTPYAQPALEELRAKTNETCAMAVLDGTEIVYVLRLPSKRVLAMNANIGTRLPALNVSLGHILLADLSIEHLEEFCKEADFRPRTQRSVSSEMALKEVLEKVREHSYAWVNGELDLALCGIAVPLRNKAGKTIAAISVSLMTEEWTESRAKKELLPKMRVAAHQIQTAMRN